MIWLIGAGLMKADCLRQGLATVAQAGPKLMTPISDYQVLTYYKPVL